jgi:hypothetical protein
MHLSSDNKGVYAVFEEMQANSAQLSRPPQAKSGRMPPRLVSSFEGNLTGRCAFRIGQADTGSLIDGQPAVDGRKGLMCG